MREFSFYASHTGFPFGRREKLLSMEKSRKASQGYKEMEKDHQAWPTYDSKLDDDTPVEGKRQSDRSFGKTFSSILPTASLSEYLLDRFGSQEQIVGIELGGPGINLFSEIDNLKPVSLSIGVTLSTPKGKVIPSSHKIIEGDLTYECVYQEVVEELEGKKADLIISRMQGGLYTLGRDPTFFTKQIAYLYENALSQNGVMLLQVPHYFRIFIPTWKALAEKAGLNINYGNKSANVDDLPILLIERDENSSQKFPLLSMQNIRDLYRPLMYTFRTGFRRPESISNIAKQPSKQRKSFSELAITKFHRITSHFQ